MNTGYNAVRDIGAKRRVNQMIISIGNVSKRLAPTLLPGGTITLLLEHALRFQQEMVTTKNHRVNKMIQHQWIAFFILISLTSTIASGQDELTSEQDRLTRLSQKLLTMELDSITDESRKLVRSIFEKFELTAVDLGRHCVQCVGEISSESSNFLTLIHFGFVHAENGKRSERTYFSSQPILTPPSNNPAGERFQISGGRDIDFLRIGDKDFGFLPGHQVKLNSSNCRDYLKGAELFDPFMASLTFVSTITNCKAQMLDLKTYDPVYAVGIGRLERFLVIGFRRKGDVVGNYRVVFDQDFPVLVQSTCTLNNKGKDFEYVRGRTRTVWKTIGDKKVPVKIHALRPSQLQDGEEMHADLNWTFDDKVPERLFEEATLGTIGFEANQ